MKIGIGRNCLLSELHPIAHTTVSYVMLSFRETQCLFCFKFFSNLVSPIFFSNIKRIFVCLRSSLQSC